MKTLLGTILAVCILWIAVDSYGFRPGMGWGCSPYDGRPCVIPEQKIERHDLGARHRAERQQRQERLHQRQMEDQVRLQNQILRQQQRDQQYRELRRSWERPSYSPPPSYNRWSDPCADGMC